MRPFRGRIFLRIIYMSQTAKAYVDPSELESTYMHEEEPTKKGEKTERQDKVTGNIEFTFRGKYNLEILPVHVVDIEEGLLANVLKRDKEHDEQEAVIVHKHIDAITAAPKSDEQAVNEIEEAESPNNQIVVEDDHKVRDLFLDLVNQMDVFPNQHQTRLRKLTESGKQYVYSEFVTSFKTSDQNRVMDNVKDHWATEQECYVVSADTADQIMKTFQALDDKARYGFELSGEREDVLILNLNGIKAAFIIDARTMPAANDNIEKHDITSLNKPVANDDVEVV